MPVVLPAAACSATTCCYGVAVAKPDKGRDGRRLQRGRSRRLALRRTRRLFSGRTGHLLAASRHAGCSRPPPPTAASRSSPSTHRALESAPPRPLEDHGTPGKMRPGPQKRGEVTPKHPLSGAVLPVMSQWVVPGMGAGNAAVPERPEEGARGCSAASALACRASATDAPAWMSALVLRRIPPPSCCLHRAAGAAPPPPTAAPPPPHAPGRCGGRECTDRLATDCARPAAVRTAGASVLRAASSMRQ